MTNSLKYPIKYFFHVIYFTIFFSSNILAQNIAPIRLFPDGVPNAKKIPVDYVEKTENGNVTKVSEPTLTPFFPAMDKANGTAVLICPGGAYAFIAMEHEGYDIAKKLNEIGITAFVLKYRLPSDFIMDNKAFGPLQDAQRAIQLIRHHAVEWGIKPNKIGVMGFSAGGHLASTLGTHFNKAIIMNKDSISLRPDFLVLIYPVISFGDYAHKGSKNNLIGKDPTVSNVEIFSNELQVTAETPPSFLVHAEDDKIVPIQNSILFYQALLKYKVKAELHLYQAGGHGFGLVNPSTNDYWFDRCKNWLQVNGFL